MTEHSGPMLTILDEIEVLARFVHYLRKDSVRQLIIAVIADDLTDADLQDPFGEATKIFDAMRDAFLQTNLPAEAHAQAQGFVLGGLIDEAPAVAALATACEELLEEGFMPQSAVPGEDLLHALQEECRNMADATVRELVQSYRTPQDAVEGASS